jgi:hypothetical protein
LGSNGKKALAAGVSAAKSVGAQRTMMRVTSPVYIITVSFHLASCASSRVGSPCQVVSAGLITPRIW